MRLLLLFVAAAVLLTAQTFKLYLKDGGFHLVREYKVEGDRVRFFSTERSEWEEMPLTLIDLDKTQKEYQSREQTIKKEAREEDEEDQAERALRKEIESVPMETGAYYNVNGQVKQLDAAPYQVITSKKRQALKMISPVPIIPGRATVVIDGAASKFILHDNRPTFYFRPEKPERFGIVRVTPKKNHRVVENISIVPVSNENLEDMKQVPVFQQQLEGNLYKVWPEKPIEPGEYAVVEYSDSGEGTDISLMVWDFAYR